MATEQGSWKQTCCGGLLRLMPSPRADSRKGLLPKLSCALASGRQSLAEFGRLRCHCGTPHTVTPSNHADILAPRCGHDCLIW